MLIQTKEDYFKYIDYLVSNAPIMTKDNLDKKQSICCSNYKFLGYSIPQVRAIAKNILKQSINNEYKILEYGESVYYEDVLIQGFVLAGIKDKAFVLKNLDNYVKKIDSWSICDSVITSFYVFKKSTTRQDFNLFADYARSDKEFYARFGIMMIFRYCMKDEYIKDIYELLNSITNHKYYVDMAISWTLCELMIRYPDSTIEEIKKKQYTKFIQNKAISKCRDSYRIDSQVKEQLKEYRIKE